MRISDWSSDVCSSDLDPLTLWRQRAQQAEHHRHVAERVEDQEQQTGGGDDGHGHGVVRACVAIEVAGYPLSECTWARQPLPATLVATKCAPTGALPGTPGGFPRARCARRLPPTA